MFTPTRTTTTSVRKALAVTLVILSLAITGCGTSAQATGGTLSLDAALPTEVPAGTKIIVGDPVTQKALQLSGEIKNLKADVEWANISGGPQTTEAFRAGALDVGSVAEIPPINATWTGLKVKIVASKFRIDPIHHPIYELGVAPGVAVRTIADLRGKKIAYSPGQAQGALVLKVLQKAGLTKADVQLVELPSTGDIYLNALSSKQVDVAPIGGVSIKRYLTKYGPDGATTISHGLRDDPSHLYALQTSLEDPAKAAAIRELVQAWARAARWVDEHPQEWVAGYYVKDQGLTAEDGAWLEQRNGHPDVPSDLTDAIKRHQATIDLLAKETANPVLKAQDLYDLRFVQVQAEAFKEGSTA
jgi:sulfonate transport system substrate-binding protein